ncbi:MAG: gluconokinase [Proteobacteria bacterium]|nr:gluconokinase [Pseudomonadota bacterium]
MIVVIWGVTGSGKTTIARALGQHLGWAWFDADDYHPKANLAKMAAGVALNDADRQPWLQRLSTLIDDYAGQKNALLACSALQMSYRKTLGFGQDHVRSVLLNGNPALIAQRLQQRQHHFMPASLLDSQFDLLQPQHDGLTLDIGQKPDDLVAQISDWLTD